ncbi:hypothetical protein RRG08_005713 [Elysia crispata]|uniref:Uncharacterized protein n=1 Tax=Elysia crispata TaxID=231223 RepID=A0AAE0YCW0_9GAST|nr:hypothetical protein RRG08_005713 [Elysia crispata]
MIAIDAHYHLTCLADLYRRSQKFEKNKKKKLDDRSKILQDQALSDLIDYIESYRDTNTTFNMPELCKLYYSRLVSLGVEEHVHTTRLRESLLAAIPDLKEVRNERNNIVQLAFDCDRSKALLQLSNHDCNHEIVILSKASKTLRQHVFGIQNTFSGTFSEDSQQNSVPTMLLSFMQMVLDGRGITGSPSPDKPVNKPSAALSISQLVVFNTVKHRSTSPNSLPRHIRDRETPIAIYIAIKIYTVTRKESIINILHERGLCISYDRLRCLTVDIANSIIAHFESQGVVAPVQAKPGMFSTFALDNIDLNPRSTTCRSSFHGTSISMVQFPDSTEEEQGETVIMNPAMMGKNNVCNLPVSYTNVQQQISLPNDNISVPALPTTKTVKLDTPPSKLKETIPTANDWLEHSHQLLSKDALDAEDWISWAAYNAVKFGQVAAITPSMMFPVFREPAHSPMMIYHGMNVIIAVSNFLNPGQTPIMIVDQPLFTLAKKNSMEIF